MMGVRGIKGKKPAEGFLETPRRREEGGGGWARRRSATESWSGRSGILFDARRSSNEERGPSTFMEADMMEGCRARLGCGRAHSR